MRCRERAKLWRYDADELSVEERVEVETHLELCDDCRGELMDVRATRQLLQSVPDEAPAVDWGRVDAGLRRSAEAELKRLQRPARFDWQIGLAMAAAACALFVLFGPSNAPEAPAEIAQVETPTDPVAPESPNPEARAWAENALHATLRTESGAVPLSEGAALVAGTTVETPADGELVLKLVDQSRVRVEPESALALRTLAEERVDLRLEHGAVQIEASHRPREAFVVDAGDLQVRVVGTAFRVMVDGERIEVEVTEGKVLVEPVVGEARAVEAGSRYAWTRATKQAEVAPVAAFDPPAPAPVEPRPVKSVARPVAAPEVKVAPAEPPAPVLAPAPTVEPPVDVAGEAPVAIEPARTESTAVRLPVSEEMPRTVEEMFLRRAEQSIGRGDCSKFLVGLEELVQHPGEAGSAEKARILRARCFDDRVMPVEADAEYRRYLRDFPTGRFAAEARSAVAH